MIFHSKAEAEKQGFTVDAHVYPWVAYKGPRFNPTETHRVLTDIEAELLKNQKKMIELYWNKEGRDFATIFAHRSLGEISKSVARVESLGAA